MNGIVKKISVFLNRFGWRQCVLKVLDELFPVKNIAVPEMPFPVPESPVSFFTDGDISAEKAVYPAELITPNGKWMLIASGKARLEKYALWRIAAFVEKHPEYGVLYFDNAVVKQQTPGKKSYICRPDFALEYLRSYDYTGSVYAIRRELAGKFEGCSKLETFLRAAEAGVKIGHLPEIIYSCEPEKENPEAETAVIAGHLTRCGIGFDDISIAAGCRRIKYSVSGNPKISILIPSFNNCAVLKRCIDSIVQKSTWDNWEIVVVENGSSEPGLFDYYRELQRHPGIKVVTYPVSEKFNYSKVNNFGVEHCSGEYILFLNNDTEVISGNFLEEMLSFAQRPDVGVTGAKLYYFDRTLQHAGVIVGAGSIAAHHSWRSRENDGGYLNTLACAREFSAVTFACAMVRKSDFFQFGALDEALGVAYNDIDFCLRMIALGKRVIYTPYAELFHHESLSRGREDTPEKQARIAGEAALFEERHREILENGDPFYNPNLSLSGQSFTLRGRLGRLKLVQRKKRS